MTTFTDLDLDPRVLKAVVEAGYETPTPIQAQAIPEALKGRDVLGIAQTGTGKTASFTLPMLSLLAKGRARARMPRSLVLAPTRELAAQVAENFETYSKHMRLNMALLIGGTSFKDQDRLIDRGVDVLIATPGRLLDHFERGKLMLTGIEIMVVDEADRMLDMGFIPDIERIFKLTPFTRQTMFYSATMAPEITRITQEFLSNPVRVEVARQATAAETIEQAVCKITPSRRDRTDKEKRDVLRALIDAEGEALTNGIIFCNRKRDVDVVAKSLTKHGYDAAPIHGDLDQSLRTRTLESFRDKSLRLLIASDVAARGLDIPSVSHVFNFDIPIHSEDYVHRIGRTGRAGRSGKALSLYVPADEKHLDKVEELLGKKIPVVANPLGDAAPAPSSDDGEEERRGTRSRSRSRSRRRDDAPAAEAEAPAQVQQEREPRESRASESRSDDTRSSDNRSHGGRSNDSRSDDNRSRGGRSRGRGRGEDNRIVGMGDHVPAFMTRDLREALADLQKDETPEDQDEEAIEAVVVEADALADVTVEAVEEKPKKPKRKRSPRKKAEPAAEDVVETAPAEANVEAETDVVAEAPVEAEDATVAAEAAPAETVAEDAPVEAAVEEKPKKPRKRRTSKKAAEVKAEDAAPTAEEPAETKAEEPTSPVADEPVAEAQPEAAPAEQPAEATAPEAPAKKPTRKPRARASAKSVINTVKAEAELEQKAS